MTRAGSSSIAATTSSGQGSSTGYETRDGTRFVNIGRQVFHVISWDPFEGEWASDVGISDDWDPCLW